MAIAALTVFSGIACVACFLLALFRQRDWKHGPVLLFLLLSLAVPGYCLLGNGIVSLSVSQPLVLAGFLALPFLVVLSIVELLSGFLLPSDKDIVGARLLVGGKSGRWLARLAALAGVILLVVVQKDRVVEVTPVDIAFVVNGLDSVILSMRLVLNLVLLLVLEFIYRYARPSQRRRGRVAFLGFLVYALFDLIFTANGMLYSMLSGSYLLASIVVTALAVPLGLFGLAYYRLAEERIVFSPSSIYSSFTLLITGSLLLALGVTVGALQTLGIRFSFFEEFVLAFTVAAALVLAIGSPQVRGRIIRLINRHLYRSKYNYREQFFRLHTTYMAGDRLQDTIDTLLENLTWNAALGKAIVFFRDPSDGCFYPQRPERSAPKEIGFISAESALVTLFDADNTPCIMNAPASVERAGFARLEPVVVRLGIQAIFPVKHGSELFGFLCLYGPRSERIDEEDIELVRVFTVSMGNVYFTYRMLEERLELRQFESFNHIAAFIVHDIKNQIATLSLLLRNAETNIADPEFQKSLIHSLQSCTGNLQALTTKMATPIRQKELSRTNCDVNDIVRSVISDGGLATLSGIRLESRLEATEMVSVDRDSLYYIVKNLVINAIEAMNGSGELSLVTGNIAALTPGIRSTFDMGDRTFARNSVYILVRDTGHGMSREFIETRLFRPFESTKDKGIGIGLYQCRTLMERMGGTIKCASQENVGTQFCCIV